MNLKDRVWNRKDKPSFKKESELSETYPLTKVMREYGLSYKDFLELPIPAYLIMLDDLIRENKKIEEGSKKLNKPKSTHK